MTTRPRGIDEGRQSPVKPYRVLDLTQELGAFCGRILADLGADVIKIEPPSGDLTRRHGPFYHDRPHDEQSLFWFIHHAGQRGITLDLTAASGQALLRRLLGPADVVLESFPPGHLESLGIGPETLLAEKPDLIVTSITPFGQTGPYRDYQAGDLELMALSGCMSVAGEPGRPPLRISHPQAGYWAGTYAAAGTILALIHRGQTGEGQHVDVSAQACLVSALGHAPAFWDLNREDQQRHGIFMTGRSVTGAKMRVIWPCVDGYLNFIIYGGEAGRRTNLALVQWMTEKGMDVPQFLREKDWGRFDIATVTQEEISQIEAAIAPFFARLTKAEFCDGVIKRDMLGFPVATPEDILADPQLEARDFWEDVAHPELGATVLYPGPFTRVAGGETGIRWRAPLLGEDNELVYGTELGLTREELRALYEGGVI